MGEGKDAVDVTLTNPFRLGIYEVTQGEWTAVMGTAPWKGQTEEVIEGENAPAMYLRYADATAFCRKLTERERLEGKLPEGWEYRMPTVAEWEWGCRAGTTTMYSFGDDVSKLVYNSTSSKLAWQAVL